jgi:hypothetical protein
MSHTVNLHHQRRQKIWVFKRKLKKLYVTVRNVKDNWKKETTWQSRDLSASFWSLPGVSFSPDHPSFQTEILIRLVSWNTRTHYAYIKMNYSLIKIPCCGSGSGSGQIRIILSDPDPADSDRYQCQAYEKVDKSYLFPQNVNMPSKIHKFMTSLTLMRKIKHCKLAKVWLKVKKIRLSVYSSSSSILRKSN